MRFNPTSRLSLILFTLSACSGDTKPPAGGDTADSDSGDSAQEDSGETGETRETGETGETATGPVAPDSRFDRFCEGTTWDASLSAATVGEADGSFVGYLSTHGDFEADTLETMKVIPPHPFYVERVRVQFADGSGTARVRLMNTWGRSYPASFPDLDTEGANVMTPIDVAVDGRGWSELDVSAQGVFLLPTQHYMIVNEYIEDGGPTVGVENLQTDESSRALLFIPGDDTPYGLDGNFRMELEGEFFCTWDDAARWFGAAVGLPFDSIASASATVADINGDNHQDLIVNDGGPVAYLGDGAGGFASPAANPWPEAAGASMLIFGDVDNDGDEDAFASTYIGADNDGDLITQNDGDCDDADITAYPGAAEVTDGIDNDCDGVADDGTDTSDADADGFSIADGDCDDTRPTVYPGGVETKDSLDNDCDGWEDEDFHHRMLMNDGTGNFTALADAGVEVTEPTTAGGFGDANEDSYLDLYFGNWLLHYPDDTAMQDRYYEGNGDGTWTDARDAAGLTLPTPWSVYGVEWNDWNNDGHPDIFVGNYHLYDNQLWANQGDGTFVDVAPEVGVDHDENESPYPQYPGGHTYGGDFADVDNDGDMDFYMCNLAHPRTQPWGDPSMFVVNSGAPDYTYENLREEYGFVYDEGDVNAQFADYDNDMDVDLAIASLYSQHYARVYRNDGDATFTDVTYETGVSVEDAVSAIWVDVDEDGDEDLVVADRAFAPYVHLYMNRVGQDNHWVNLRLQGTTTNRDGIGARVTLVAGGVSQLRDMQGGGGLENTQKPKLIHFGLGSNTAVDAVTVRWVGGATESFTGVGADGTWTLVEGSGVAAP